MSHYLHFKGQNGPKSEKYLTKSISCSEFMGNNIKPTSYCWNKTHHSKDRKGLGYEPRYYDYKIWDDVTIIKSGTKCMALNNEITSVVYYTLKIIPSKTRQLRQSNTHGIPFCNNKPMFGWPLMNELSRSKFQMEKWKIEVQMVRIKSATGARRIDTESEKNKHKFKDMSRG